MRLAARQALPGLREDAPAAWPLWRIEQGRPDPAPAHVDTDHAVIHADRGVTLTLGREARTLRVGADRPVATETLVHPLLAPAGAVIAAWGGGAALHGSTVWLDGRAWGVLGDSGSGKSTLVAALCRAGGGLLSDDVAVVDRGIVQSGPETIDLRHPEPGTVDAGRADPDGRERHRLHLPGAPCTTPLGGWLHLEWGDEMAPQPLDTGERVALLERHLVAPVLPETLLDLVGAACLRVRRPRRRDAADAHAERLREALGRVAVGA